MKSLRFPSAVSLGILIGTNVLLASLSTVSAQGIPSPHNATSGAQTESALVAKARRGDLALGDLIERLGAPYATTRRRAASAVLKLRDHYVAGARAVVERRYAGKAGPMAAANALETLGFFRVSDAPILRGAAHHIGFSWTPTPSNSLFASPHLRPRSTFPAAKVLVRAGFAALPVLADVIATAPLPSADKPARGDAIALACAYTILGPATATWLQEEAAKSDGTRRAALEDAAHFVTAQTASFEEGKLAQDQLPLWLSDLGLENVFDESYGYEDRAPIPLNTYKIRWDAAASLFDEKTLVKDRAMPGFDNAPLPASTVARLEITRTMRLLTINIIERLPSYSEHGGNDYAPFPLAAQTDAVRLVGALRLMPQVAAWKMWQRLYKVSLTRPVDENISDDMSATLWALGQIGTPAAELLLGRIAHQSGPDSQRAATYGLSVVLGRYAPDCLNTEILRLQRLREAKGQPLQPDSYEGSYAAMLKLGQEKHWFESQGYGFGNPNAYDLIFPKDEVNNSDAP